MTNESGYQVLARKYRPGKLSEVIGQEATVRTLENAIKSDRIPHAFILTGIRGVGKTSTARIIARSLLCVAEDGKGEKPTTEPCGVCEQCKAIADDRHVDVLEMDAASRTGVSDIREIIENVHYLPVSARYKIYIIDEVHMLSKSAFNALLKTLEEPPPHVKFIFATTEIRKIPVTILSRCMRFDLTRVSIDVLTQHLAKVAEQEKATIDEAALSLIAHSAEGSVRDALSLLDRVIGDVGENAITHEQVRAMLGIADKTKIFDLFELVVHGKADEAVTYLRALYDEGADPVSVLQDIAELCHYVTQLKVVPDLANAPHIPERDKIRGESLSKRLTIPFLARMWQMLLKGISESVTASNTLLAVEMVIVRLTYSSNLPTPGDLVKDLQATTKESTNGVSTGAPSQVPSGAVTNSNNPKTFNEMIKLFNVKGEEFIAGYLHDVNLVQFDTKARSVEFRPGPTTPPDLAGRVGDLLSQWTGNRWIAIVSNGAGEKTLRQKKAAELEDRQRQALEDPSVQAIMDLFPGTQVTKVEVVSEEAIAPKEESVSEHVEQEEPVKVGEQQQ